MKTKYDKLPLESLSDEQLDDFLEYLDNPFDDQRKDNLKKRINHEKNMKKLSFFKKNKKRLILLGTAASLLLLTAFTQRDELRLLYLKHFGTESQVLLINSDRLSAEVTDQGLRFKALASFKNDETTYFLAEFTDETADRLAEDTQLFNWQMLNGGNSRVIDYNEETKTATILTKAVSTNSNAPTGYQLNSFLSHEQSFNKTIDIHLTKYLTDTAEWIDISKQLTQGGGYDEDNSEKIGLKWEQVTKNALKPDRINEPLSAKELTLSNVAYKDKLLHLQLKEPNTVQNTILDVSLVNKETGKETSYLASYQVDQGTHDNETGRSDYTEYVFNISEKELANVELNVEGWDYDTYQKGNWAIQLKEPKSLPTKSLTDVELTVDKQAVRLKNILLSPFSLSFDYKPQELREASFDMTIVTTDQKEKELKISGSDLSSFEQPNEDDHFTYEFGYLDLERVEKVLINGKELPFKQ